MFTKLAPYRKTVIAVVGGLLAWGALVVVSAPAHIVASEWLSLGTTLAIALGVYQVPNKETK